VPRPSGLAIHPWHPQPDVPQALVRELLAELGSTPLGVLRPRRRQWVPHPVFNVPSAGTASGGATPTTPSSLTSTERNTQPCHRRHRVQHSPNTGDPPPTPPPPPSKIPNRHSVGWIGSPCGPSSVNSVLLRRTSWSSYRMTFESFCPRSGIRLCVICPPWQQILQLAHGLGTSMHARGCSDSTSRGLAEAPAREGLL
jgi:hypothetical protein